MSRKTKPHSRNLLLLSLIKEKSRWREWGCIRATKMNRIRTGEDVGRTSTGRSWACSPSRRKGGNIPKKPQDGTESERTFSEAVVVAGRPGLLPHASAAALQRGHDAGASAAPCLAFCFRDLSRFNPFPFTSVHQRRGHLTACQQKSQEKQKPPDRCLRAKKISQKKRNNNQVSKTSNLWVTLLRVLIPKRDVSESTK